MKATEFSPQRKSQQTPVKASATTRIIAEHAPTIVQEKKLVKKVTTAPAPVDAAMYGIDDPHGPEVRRLRARHPEVFKKLKNWD